MNLRTRSALSIGLSIGLMIGSVLTVSECSGATHLFRHSSAAVSHEDYRAHLIRFEGYKTTAYKDSRGNWTVGIGHRIRTDKGEPVKIGVKRSAVEIEALFRTDLGAAIDDCRALMPEFDRKPKRVKLVLVSLAFNLGRENLRKFNRFISAVNGSDYFTAAKELRDSKWYKQVGDRGFHHVTELVCAHKEIVGT